VTSWLVAIGSVALPLILFGGWMLTGVLKKRALVGLARAEGWAPAAGSTRTARGNRDRCER
jgi:hypothetical protein